MIVHAFDLRTRIHRQNEKHSHKNWVRSRLPLISFSFVVFILVWVLSLNSCLGDFSTFQSLRVSHALSLSLFLFRPLPQSSNNTCTHTLPLSLRIAFGACQMFRYFSVFLSFFVFAVDRQWETPCRPLSHSCDVALLTEHFVLLQSQSNLKANVEKCLSYLLSGFNCNEIYVMFAMPNKFLCAPLFTWELFILFLFLMTFQKYVRRKW